jgi:ABC-type transport system involved in multi-copper enzyme maturation permease subunit
MSSIWPLAFITFKEGIRNRAIYGISLFALLLLAANLLISGMMMRSAGKTAVDMALSTVSLSGLLLVLFVGINLIAKDLDRRTIYMVLARPISRSRYIVGKFLGMVLLILATVAILAVFAALSILLVKFAYPDYFDRFSWPPVVLAVALTALMLVMLSAISFLFASFASTSFITLALTIITYIIGQSISEVKALVEAPGTISPGYEPSGITVAIVRTAYYLFPNLSFFDVKLQAAHGLAIPPVTIMWTVAYGIIYTSIIILFAALIFRRKEFP